MSLIGKKIGVLGGGISSERAISLSSARAAQEALRRNGPEVVFVDIVTSEENRIKDILGLCRIDAAFIALHGEFGEDGGIQRILEQLNIIYTGSPPAASRKAMDKIISKKIFVKQGIPTPSFIICNSRDAVPANISFPVVIKPNYSGSSLGVSIPRIRRELAESVDTAFKYGEGVIIEEYIQGRELTVGILDDTPLGVVEIIPQSGYFDFHSKYKEKRTRIIAPAELDKTAYNTVQRAALASHKALGCRHFSRVDIRLGKDGVPYVLEVNSIPGLTSHSLFPISAQVCGIDFDSLIIKMIKLAIHEKTQIQKV